MRKDLSIVMTHKGVGLNKLRFTGYTEPWEQKKLGDLGEIVTGSTPTKKNEKYWNSSDLPWVSVGDFKHKYIQETELFLSNEGAKASRIVPANSILVNCIGAIGKMAMTVKECATNQQINAFIPNEDTDPNFDYYAIKSNIRQLHKLTTKSVLSQVNKSSFSTVTIPLPSLAEQERIGGFLSALDERLRVQSELVDLLALEYTGYSQRIFNQTLRFKDENGNNYPDWEQKKLGEIFEKYTDTTIHVSDDEEYTQVTISKNRGILRRGTIKGEKIGRKRQFVIDLEKYPDTLTFIRQGVFDGSIGFVPEELHGAIVTENMPLLDLDNQLASKEYMTNYFNSYDYYIKVLQPIKPSGSAQKALHEKDWLKQEIPLPSLPEQEKIGGFLSALSARIEAERALLTQYKEQKKAYLQKLLP